MPAIFGCCEVPGPDGTPHWLTLPLARAPRDTLITDLAFAADARSTLDARLERLPWLMNGRGPLADRTRAHLFGALDTPAAFVEAGLRLVAESLCLPAGFIRSSALRIDPSLRGQYRVVAIVAAVGGSAYVNASGGRALYEPRDFERRGMSRHRAARGHGARSTVMSRPPPPRGRIARRGDR